MPKIVTKIEASLHVMPTASDWEVFHELLEPLAFAYDKRFELGDGVKVYRVDVVKDVPTLTIEVHWSDQPMDEIVDQVIDRIHTLDPHAAIRFWTEPTPQKYAAPAAEKVDDPAAAPVVETVDDPAAEPRILPEGLMP